MPKQGRDKYDVSGDPEAQYIDAAQTVLANKVGITDLAALQIAEEAALARAYELLFSEVRADTPITSELIALVHHRIFGELYQWAGRWRTVQISKENTIWPAAQFLDASMQTFERDVLDRFPVASLESDEDFCRAVGEIHGEFLAIHPFREGNARTIKLVTDLLAAQSGRPLLLYDATEHGTLQYTAAAKTALARKDYEPMIGVIQQALAAARLRQ